MPDTSYPFAEYRCSLAELAGADYLEAVCQARAALSGESVEALLAEAHRPVEFYPAAWHEQLLSRLPQVGQRVCAGPGTSAAGATSRAFAAATHSDAAPLTGYGFYRVGEDGRLYLLTKSEHYHTPLGHCFPGYQLLETARHLGVPNATHNNTRGHLTRLLEEELVRVAARPGRAATAAATGGRCWPPRSRAPVLNRVLGLETGSLVVGGRPFKMLLARFYRHRRKMPRQPRVRTGSVPGPARAGQRRCGRPRSPTTTARPITDAD